MVMKKIVLSIVLLCSFSVGAQQQNNFSMWQSTGSWLNAGATAIMFQEYSFFANYRSQYLTSAAIPNRTNLFVAEAKAFEGKISNGWIGTGLHFVNDETGIGSTKLATNSAYVPFNYVAQLQEKTFVGVGFKPGFINRSLVTDFQTWDNQWNGIAFDQYIPDNELSARKFTVFDMSAGLFFQTTTYGEHEFKFGVAANHITSPDVRFTTVTDQLFRQYVFHGKAAFKLERYRFKLAPQFTSFIQGPITYHQVGASLDITIREGSRRTLFVQDKFFGIGMHYRTDNTLVTALILELEGFTIGAAFDADLGEASTATSGALAAEGFIK
ncbi:unnamed protein product, partial [Chrysoparadoxa australica]